MNNTGKAAGGITILGVLAFLFHLSHTSLSIWEATKPKTISTEEILEINMRLQNDIDSIAKNTPDTARRDSLIRERAFRNIRVN